MYKTHNIRPFLANPTVSYSALIFTALIGATIPSLLFKEINTITPLILGVIAAALTESDDNFKGRIKAQFLTLLCFAIATFSIELLFDYPIFFAIGLFSSSILFIMLGAIGPRYAKIAFGSLLIAIYTMLGADKSVNLWFQPALLLGGCCWYFLLSMIWYAAKPMQPVQHSLSTVFEALANYFQVKRELFHPVSGLIPQPYRINEAQLNAKTVAALNHCKSTFLARSKRGQVDGPSDRFLKIYFLAQDIHERVSSSHARYQDLAEVFRFSDVMFRFKTLLEMQSIACSDISNSIRLGVPYNHGNKTKAALAELNDSIVHIEQQGNPNWQVFVPQLKYLFNNLATIEEQLSNIDNPDALPEEMEDTLEDTEAHTIKAMWQRIKINLTPSSLLFRHAIRLSLALTFGYLLIQAFAIDNGYWILLTTLFVCQPNYSATKQKLISRVVGTTVGLLVGVLLLYLFPSNTVQLAVIILSGVAFFAFRVNNYSYATAFITILVLFCFDQLGEGYAVVLPRLADTLIGCALAVLSVSFILPDWQSKRLHNVMSASITSNKLYLAQIIGQYRIGKQNDLQYRVARRKAHNQSALLSSAINNMLMEPGKHRGATEHSFRFLTLNHALLSYISALGAHRTRLDDHVTHQLILDAHRDIHAHLDAISQQLDNECEACFIDGNNELVSQRLNQWRDDQGPSAKMVLQQLHLIHKMLPELHQLADALASKPVKISRTKVKRRSKQAK